MIRVCALLAMAAPVDPHAPLYGGGLGGGISPGSPGGGGGGEKARLCQSVPYMEGRLFTDRDQAVDDVCV